MAHIEYLCQVKTFRMLTPTVFEIGFQPDQKVPFLAGQFCSMIIEGRGPEGRNLRRAYSIASHPEQDIIELCIKKVENGPGSSFLSEKRPGDTVRCLFPYGTFVYKSAPARNVVFIATGTGVSPFRSILLSEAFKKNPPLSSTLLLGVREESELLYQEELAKVRGTQMEFFVSRPSATYRGSKGRVTDYLYGLGDAYPWEGTDFYLCGNGAMIDEVKLFLVQKGVPKTAIFQEVYYKPKPGAE